MHRILWFAFVTVVLVSPAFCRDPRTGRPDRLTLAVAVDNAASVPADVLREAEKEASRIYAGAGIRLGWTECAPKEGQGECVGDRGSSDVELLLTSGIPPLAVQLSGETYGAAVHSDDAHPAMAIILWDRVVATDIRRFFLSRGALLGQLIAHELGHLLLGPGAHSSSGIMTAHWIGQTLKDAGKGSLAFSQQQCERMRAHLMAAKAEIEAAALRR